MAKKVGRPRLPKDQARKELVAARVSRDELKAFRHEAEKDGLSLSDWARQALLKAVKNQKQDDGAHGS